MKKKRAPSCKKRRRLMMAPVRSAWPALPARVSALRRLWDSEWDLCLPAATMGHWISAPFAQKVSWIGWTSSSASLLSLSHLFPELADRFFFSRPSTSSFSLSSNHFVSSGKKKNKQKPLPAPSSKPSFFSRSSPSRGVQAKRPPRHRESRRR